MSRDQQRLADYLAHILEAIERIDRYTAAMDELTFLNNQLVQDAVIRNFEIQGSTDQGNRPRLPLHCRSIESAQGVCCPWL